MQHDGPGQGSSRALATALDGFRCAVIHVDAAMRLLGCNAAAECMLAAPGPLRLDRGRLAARDAGDDAALGGLVVDASSGLAPRTDRYHRLQTNGGPVLRVAPLPGETGGTALIFLTDPGAPGADRARDLAEAFGLTPAESRVAAGLLHGRSIRAIAADEGIGEQTVRHHTKALFTKTGTRRQAELVHLLVTSVGLHTPL